MKKIQIYLILPAIIGIFILGFRPSAHPKKENSHDKFRKDMLESIMEFSNDSIPIDSLYIPEWLTKKDSVIFPILD